MHVEPNKHPFETSIILAWHLIWVNQDQIQIPAEVWQWELLVAASESAITLDVNKL